jgi:amino-acid N-acetyltransferase
MMQTEILNTLQLQIATTELQRQQVIDLLLQHQLPVTDIDDDKILYLLQDGEKMAGTAGLEIFEDCALLRSVSVIKDAQGRGYGKFINTAIEQYVKDAGINCLYLLTTTAKQFFEKQGYCVINRNDAPESVKQTAEFSSLCPASAVVMKKHI